MALHSLESHFEDMISHDLLLGWGGGGGRGGGGKGRRSGRVLGVWLMEGGGNHAISDGYFSDRNVFSCCHSPKPSYLFYFLFLFRVGWFSLLCLELLD